MNMRFKSCSPRGGGYSTYVYANPSVKKKFGKNYRTTNTYSGRSVNISETDTAYHLAVLLAGFSKEETKVRLEGNLLRITATKNTTENQADTTVKYNRKEFSINDFDRSFELPDTVDISAIEAKQENGILHISLPKTTKPEATTISINID